MSKILEIKRKTAEIQRVTSTLAELDLKREERYEEIKRIEDHIKITETTLKKLEKELDDIHKSPEKPQA